MHVGMVQAVAFMTGDLPSSHPPSIHHRRSDALYKSNIEAVHTVRLKTTPRTQQKRETGMRLEDESGTLGLLVTAELEVLASLERELSRSAAIL
jgi:hypothetical protein